VPIESVALIVSCLFWCLSLTSYCANRVSRAHCQLSVLVLVTYFLLCQSSQSRLLSAVCYGVCHLLPIVPTESVALIVSCLFWCLSLTICGATKLVPLTVSHLFRFLLLTHYRAMRVSYPTISRSFWCPSLTHCQAHASQSRSLSVDFSGFCHLRSNVPPQSLALTINRLFWYLSLTCCRATRVSSSYRQLSVLICVTYVLSCHRSQSRSLSVVCSIVCHLRPVVPSRSATFIVSLLCCCLSLTSCRATRDQSRSLSAFCFGVCHLQPFVTSGLVTLTVSYLF
jgi:hypothetical protein